jgi:hypothetical protein
VTFPAVDPKEWSLENSRKASGLDRISGETVAFEYQTWRRKNSG